MCPITLGRDYTHSPSYMHSMIGFGNTQSEGCDHSHTPSYMYSMIVFGNTQSKNQKVHIQVESLGKWVKLIYMDNFPL
jgi:hypothetical protein